MSGLVRELLVEIKENVDSLSHVLWPQNQG